MPNLRTLKYFSESLSAPLFEVFEVFDNPNHFMHSDLLSDLSKINPIELDEYVKSKQIDFYTENAKDVDLSRRCWFLVGLLNNEIAKRRLSVLVSEENRPLPYNSENLKNCVINNDNLVCISMLKIAHCGIVYNDFGYRLCPSTEADNSSYWLYLELSELFLRKKKSFSIRLDPFIEKSLNEYNPMMFRMPIYGLPLDWERLKALKSDDYGQFVNEEEYVYFGRTDYVWHNTNNEVHFTCEELPKLEYCKYRGSRYFHAIFDKQTGSITHCDGAIRIYDEDELSKRMETHIRKPEARKVGKRVKIFQTNDVLDKEDFTSLVMSFFVWNDDIRSYFENTA